MSRPKLKGLWYRLVLWPGVLVWSCVSARLAAQADSCGDRAHRFAAAPVSSAQGKHVQMLALREPSWTARARAFTDVASAKTTSVSFWRKSRVRPNPKLQYTMRAGNATGLVVEQSLTAALAHPALG